MDTVDAYGLPIDELTQGIDRWFWPLSMPELELSPKVKRACHVLALDDERNTFHPVLWDEEHEPAAALEATHVTMNASRRSGSPGCMPTSAAGIRTMRCRTCR